MVAAVETDVGPIDILINSAGAARRYTPETLTPHASHDTIDAKHFMKVGKRMVKFWDMHGTYAGGLSDGRFTFKYRDYMVPALFVFAVLNTRPQFTPIPNEPTMDRYHIALFIHIVALVVAAGCNVAGSSPEALG
jgi:NAD(P)-dependent dehydrogenase (short-subunit alcohol dehydrogenase family)